MPEILLHYIWQHCLWAGFPQQTTDGRPVEILSVGQHNTDAGPDFMNVRLRIGGYEWAGNVEIHTYSSDWYKHHHHTDKAYDHIILHVVRNADKQVYNSEGEAVPQCELRYPEDQDYLTELIEYARKMDSAEGMIECNKILLQDPDILTQGWRNALLRRRMACKQQSIEHLLEITNHSWEHAFYITLAHNFGFHTNGIPFETLAINTPLSYLQKHRNSLFQLTAMLLGQSGLLNADTVRDDENQRLYREYLFLQKKFALKPLDGHIWKRGRMRPQAFPEVRIRQFAQLLFQSEFLFSQLMETDKLSDLVDLLTLRQLSQDDCAHLAPPAPIGRDSVRILLINSVIPYKYAYALAYQNPAQAERAYALLEQIAPEDNKIIRQWRLLGQSVRSAADTQALIHLYRYYCRSHKCMNCQVGYQIFIERQLPLL